ncbi:polyprenyl synthetase family protein [Blastococcus saxobsidens]|uniref:Geranylgeranyl pyrophosphate synthase n=1 Tax=Blastococcus saxobsidens (strain DD2) TaxID=1146883 RepID=H6RL61_BLASD|nr:polyprenyl synthetase family protein [Blastococcus saxobsidens]CCG01191.1 geranylgeranyl pyrophosphate synthase [Includes: Dimethylallyltranstransferase; Geranyltranstransferase; Farnesyltranstransferase] [Blastococcus saxobsidens DD2]
MTATLPPNLPAARTLVDPWLRGAVAGLAPSLREVAEHHFGWRDLDGRGTTATGKALRPALTLLGARAAGADEVDAGPVAAAVELVHNFSLLHDDLMDGDETRHHRATAWAAFGPARAILTGDALLALASQLLQQRPAAWAWEVSRCLTEATAELISGQADDLAFEQRLDVSVEEYLAMARRKTAALLSCSVRAGALVGSAPPAQAAALARFGTHLGLAFQLVDDLLGIWGDPADTGKPPRSDLRTRKQNGPVVAALAARTPAAGRLRSLLATGAPQQGADLDLAADLVEQAGGRAWAEAEADRHTRLALEALADAAVPVDVDRELTELALFVTTRRC